MKLLFLLLVFCAAAPVCRCQTALTDVAADTPATGVVVHADPRLALLAHRTVAAPARKWVIRSARGYRLQIYNGNDRVKATQTKIDFIRRFPSIRTYMSYTAPQFRVKVGDFSSRAEAQRLYEQIRMLYSPVMIVPDVIVVNTLKND
jgi:hypothetical protein